MFSTPTIIGWLSASSSPRQTKLTGFGLGHFNCCHVVILQIEFIRSTSSNTIIKYYLNANPEGYVYSDILQNTRMCVSVDESGKKCSVKNAMSRNYCQKNMRFETNQIGVLPHALTWGISLISSR